MRCVSCEGHPPGASAPPSRPLTVSLVLGHGLPRREASVRHAQWAGWSLSVRGRGEGPRPKRFGDGTQGGENGRKQEGRRPGWKQGRCGEADWSQDHARSPAPDSRSSQTLGLGSITPSPAGLPPTGPWRPLAPRPVPLPPPPAWTVQLRSSRVSSDRDPQQRGGLHQTGAAKRGATVPLLPVPPPRTRKTGKNKHVLRWYGTAPGLQRTGAPVN